LTGSPVPSWLDLTGSIIGKTTTVFDTVAVKLCASVTKSSFDPITCSLATCGGICALDKRAMGPLPADLTAQGLDTSAVRIGGDFTDPNTSPVGRTAWWQQAKNLDWWMGSNHGVDSVFGTEIASSAFVDFSQNPSENLVTGAGPVWGCTAVAVVSNFGAWTAHFWQGFFSDDSLFAPEVIGFLGNGNALENYPGLSQLAAPGGPFDLAHVSFLSILIMTPQTFEMLQNSPFERPQAQPGFGPLYPAQIAQMQQRLDEIFGVTDLKIS
jgi:hypothetical protein